MAGHMSTWNTKDEPSRKAFPNVIVLHDLGPVTSRQVQYLVHALRNQGFVLKHFSPTFLVNSRSYYDQTVFGGTD